MGRPKGSKNKKAPTTGHVPPVVASEPVKEAVAYQPAPNMGKKAPDPKVCQCGHAETLHYGSESRWCNNHGCSCQGFK